MLLTKAEIEKLMQGTTAGPWRSTGDFVEGIQGGDIFGEYGAYKEDCGLIASAPDLAQTCLDLYARIEDMEKEREACLAYCRAQNGLPYCKNCGLGDKGDVPLKTYDK